MDRVTWPSLFFSGKAAVEALDRIPEDVEFPVSARDFFFNLSFQGPSTATDPSNGTVLFLQSAGPEAFQRLDGLKDCLILLPVGSDPGYLSRENVVLFSRNPKYAYAKLLTLLFPLSLQRGTFSAKPLPGVQTDPSFVLTEGVTIEPFVTIGRDTVIGCGTYVMRGASIGPRVRIGRDCVIGEGAVIGDPGFGFAFDGDRTPLRIPQLGGVVIGDRVELGSHGTIGAGTISPTVLEDGVKAGNHVHVGHNSKVGSGTILCVGTTISGSCRIGERCWLSPGVQVRNKTTVGNGATAGIGAVIVKDVAACQTVVGLPARPTGNMVPWFDSKKGIP